MNRNEVSATDAMNVLRIGVWSYEQDDGKPPRMYGNEALKILRADPSFDAVLTDLWMPELDGIGIAREIRADAKLSSLPIFLITADVEAKQMSSDFSGVLLKPITLDGIKAILV